MEGTNFIENLNINLKLSNQ